jgi:uncharacterized protein (DUF1697 family)
VRSIEQIADLVKANPFVKVAMTKAIRLYVTFLSDKPPKMKPTTQRGYTILKATYSEVFSCLDLAKTGTVDAMGVLERTYGKNITTRNWNTIERILVQASR